MRALIAILVTIRTTAILAVIAVLAFGSLSASVSAGTYDHHAFVSIDDHSLQGERQAASCPSGDVSGGHGMDDGNCCIGTCTTILTVAAPVDVPERLLVLSGPAFRPLSARSSFVEFVRPPSLSI
ncbi:hypothetical protein ACK8OR_03530 [Jannaschia sp. KMU-145]|uniref:hypothetical protein n=1 Tax=Jannaschia halovivens TaxID=3388667 RepID=UPI00396B2B2D